MTAADAEFFESTADHRVESVPLAHLSIELGHFYCADLGHGVDFFRDHFRRIARWVAATRLACDDMVPGKRPRISTCVLIDDYFGQPETPRKLVPKLLETARANGLEINYIARESGCAGLTPPADSADGPASVDGPASADGAQAGYRTDPMGAAPAGLSPADLVEARLVEDPPPDTTGARPPVRQTGWLCNGRRSPATDRHEAMKEAARWKPPSENAAVNHSVFADIELWSGSGQDRRWSCAMLAAVWQLLRLGVLRDNGRRVAAPQPLPDDLPDDWRRLPPVARVGDRVAPFSAYRTMTICAPLFMPIENAVRTILQQVAVDPAVAAQVGARGGDEGIELPPAVIDRIEHLFVDTGPVRGAGAG